MIASDLQPLEKRLLEAGLAEADLVAARSDERWRPPRNE